MASTGEAATWRLGHRPALDGVRGLAILLVLAGHLYLPGAALGAPPVGVTVFFTLSGFLITSLLLERDEGLGRFYLRRAARLGPALLIVVTGYVVLRLAFVGDLADWGMILGALTYTSNWLRMTDVYVAGQTGLSHLWSLAVEEQFYLLWPLLLAPTARLPKRWALFVVGTLAAGSFLERALAYQAHGFMRAYNGFDTRAGELLIGCALALVMSGRVERRVGSWLAALALLLVVLTSMAREPFSVVLAPSLVAALTVVAIYVSVNGDGPAWLGSRWLRWLGRRSYAIYLFHVPIRWTIEQRVDLPWWFLAPLVLLIVLPLAEMSWRYVEAPVLALTARRLRDAVEREPRAGREAARAHRQINAGDCGRVLPQHLEEAHGLRGG